MPSPATCLSPIPSTFHAITADTAIAPKLRSVVEHVRQHPMPLGGGVMYYHGSRPAGRLPEVVEGLKPDDMHSAGRVEPYSRVMLALANVGVGGLDEAHDTVQPMTHVPEANYVHALLHRREGERVGELGLRGWSNSAYWWDETGSHPLFGMVLSKADETSQDLPAVRSRLWPAGAAPRHWDPDAMVRLMAAAQSGAEADAAAARWSVHMQHFEWEALLLYCHDAAERVAAAAAAGAAAAPERT